MTDMVNNQNNKDKALNIFIHVAVVIYLIIVVYPLWYILCASFSNVFKIADTPLLLWPRGFTLDSYKMVFQAPDIWTGYLNSIIYMGTGTTLNIAMTLIAAYPLSRDSLPGKKWISKLLIVTMYVSGGMIPLYLVVTGLGIRDTLLAMIIPNAVNVYFVIISISFMKSTIPESFQEAARIDGAGNIRIFRTIIVPLSAPLIGVLALQYGLAHWNSYTQAMIYLSTKSKYPLQLVLRDILIKADASFVAGLTMNEDIDYAAQTAMKEGFKYVSMVVSSVPLLIIYPFLKKYFAKGLIIGGIKE